MQKQESPRDLLKIIGSRLQTIRQEMNLSQSEMAAALGITGTGANVYVSQMENRGIPGLHTFTYLAWVANQGYNLNWIIKMDNTLEPMKNPAAFNWPQFKELMDAVNPMVNELTTIYSGENPPKGSPSANR